AATEFSVNGDSGEATGRAVPGRAGSAVQLGGFGVKAYGGNPREGIESGVVGLHDHAMPQGGECVSDRRVDAFVEVGLLALAVDARRRDGGGQRQLEIAPVDERVED